MARTRKEDVTYSIEEHIAILKENDSNDWCKAVDRISWNGRPSTLDIRNRNMSNPNIFPKGISLSDEEADRLADILLEQDYGSIETLQEALERKKNRFTISSSSVTNTHGDGEGGRVVIDLGPDEWFITE